ncbi:phage tail length tape measure family protein [Sphingopyxis sp. GW247-27LB]|uniref:phage tail length tape measure family protein n=1 Tax=Sphingopyxis sp. GW247-27LB TaxID=2012632 RepID=UPI000BA60952|nr:phage tail length tape measure family protein [Sphingopyxis sp. GW247-27LB]PAL23540.1 hypothetical protein CD928_05590 [Sphingopyxis sp. GW247-27LB]
MATRDVQLVIKARDEAKRIFDSISGSVATLIGNQDRLKTSGATLSTEMSSIVSQLKTLDTAYTKIVGAADRAEAAQKRQRDALAASKAQYAATAVELRNLATAQERLQVSIVDQHLAGQDTAGTIAQLKAVNAAIVTQTAARGRLKASISAQEASLASEAASFQQLGSIAIATEQAIESLTAAQVQQARAADAVADSQEQAARRIAAARQIQSQIASSTGLGGGGKSAEDSAAVFAADFDRAADAAERLRQRVDPLYAIQSRLNTELAEANALYRKGALSADQLADAERRLKLEAEQAATALGRTGRGERGAAGLFGLKPYELTNLGYQVNDVFTQLASGTAPLQVIAQQGGQILQLLPNIGAHLVKAFTNPYVLAGIATLATVGTIMVKAANDAQRLDKVRGILAGVGETSNAAARELEGIAEKLEDIGLTAEQSISTLRNFVTQGLNTEYLVSFAQMAKQVAEVTGDDLPEAMEKVQDAFTQGYDAVAELDDELQFLTVTERDHIRALFDSGEAAEARAEAVRKLAEHLRDQKRASDEAKSGLDSLTDGLDKFLDRLADTRVVRGFIDLLDELADKAGRGLRIFTGDASVEDYTAEIDRLQGKLDELKKEPKTLLDGPIDFARYQYQVSILTSTLERLRKERDEAARRATQQQPTGDTVNEESAARQKRRKDRIDELKLEDDINKARADADKIRLAGEKAYREEVEKTGDVVVAQVARQVAEDKKREELRKKNERDAQKSIQLDLPVQGRISSGFGFRTHPVTGKKSFHGGIDIAAPKGTAVGAAADAIVGEVGFDPLLGKYVKLNHGKGLITVYGHLSDNSQVVKGDSVQRGQTIGRVGSTGRSTGNHTHFAVQENGAYVDPLRNGRRFKGGNVGDAQIDVQKEMAKLQKQQEDFNAEIDAENEKRRVNIAYLEKARTLSAEGVIDAERQKAIDEAIFDAETKAQKKGIELDKERRDAIAETVGLEYDLINARERATAAVDASTGERSALLQLLDQAKESRDTGEIDRLEAELAKVEDRLEANIAKAIDFWKTMGDTPEARTAINGLKSLQNSLVLDERRRGVATVSEPIDRVQQQRSALMEQIQFYQDLGQGNVVEELKEQLRAVNAELLAGINNAIEWYQVHQGPDSQAAILGLENLRNQVIATSQEFQISAGQIQQLFAGGLTNAVTMFTEKLVETGNPLSALRDAALNFVADFLEGIAQMLLQMAALQVASQIGFGGLAGGLTGLLNAGPLIAASTSLTAAGTLVQTAGTTMFASAAAWLGTAAAISTAATLLMAANTVGSAGVFHGGGIAGAASRTRRVSPAWFSAAMRYHTGGVAGLRPNEVPAILERGEEIITRNDPRHRGNGGLDDGGTPLAERVKVTVNNLLDSGDIVERGLSTRAGEKSVLNIIARNPSVVQQAAGGN